MRSAASSIPIDSRTSPQPMPSAARALGRNRAMAHREWVPGKALDAPQAFGQREQPQALQESPHAAFVRLHVDGDDAAEALHLTLGERVLGMALKARIDHALDLPVAFQMPRHRAARSRSAAPCAAPASSSPRRARKEG